MGIPLTNATALTIAVLTFLGLGWYPECICAAVLLVLQPGQRNRNRSMDDGPTNIP